MSRVFGTCSWADLLFILWFSLIFYCLRAGFIPCLDNDWRFLVWPPEIVGIVDGSFCIVLLFFNCTFICIVTLCHVVALNMLILQAVFNSIKQCCSSDCDIFVKLQIVEDLSIKEKVVKGQRCSASRRGPGFDAGATSRWNRCRAWTRPEAGALLVPGGETRWPNLPLSIWCFLYHEQH